MASSLKDSALALETPLSAAATPCRVTTREVTRSKQHHAAGREESHINDVAVKSNDWCNESAIDRSRIIASFVFFHVDHPDNLKDTILRATKLLECVLSAESLLSVIEMGVRRRDQGRGRNVGKKMNWDLRKIQTHLCSEPCKPKRHSGVNIREQPLRRGVASGDFLLLLLIRFISQPTERNSIP